MAKKNRFSNPRNRNDPALDPTFQMILFLIIIRGSVLCVRRRPSEPESTLAATCASADCEAATRATTAASRATWPAPGRAGASPSSSSVSSDFKKEKFKGLPYVPSTEFGEFFLPCPPCRSTKSAYHVCLQIWCLFDTPAPSVRTSYIEAPLSQSLWSFTHHDRGQF